MARNASDGNLAQVVIWCHPTSGDFPVSHSFEKFAGHILVVHDTFADEHPVVVLRARGLEVWNVSFRSPHDDVVDLEQRHPVDRRSFIVFCGDLVANHFPIQGRADRCGNQAQQKLGCSSQYFQN